jgi:hypothetical protein
MKNIKYNILEQIITEGRLEDMIKKYEGSVSEDMVRQLSAGDPSGNNKYLDWMCAQRKDTLQTPNQTLKLKKLQKTSILTQPLMILRLCVSILKNKNLKMHQELKFMKMING